jgi:hypothetical protein
MQATLRIKRPATGPQLVLRIGCCYSSLTKVCRTSSGRSPQPPKPGDPNRIATSGHSVFQLRPTRGLLQSGDYWLFQLALSELLDGILQQLFEHSRAGRLQDNRAGARLLGSRERRLERIAG